jgi:DNA-binding CsgD family transcriptional regulator
MDPRALARDVEGLGRAGLALPDFVVRARTIIARRVPFAACAFIATDPATMLPRWVLNEIPAPRALVPRWLFIEMSEARHLNLADVQSRRQRTFLLSAETAGELERSTRYREVYRPLGLRYELRIVFRARGITWGVMALIRNEREPDFEPDEVELVDHMVTPFTEGLRRTLLRSSTEDALIDDSPAVLVLSRDDQVVSRTDLAATLLDELRDMGAGGPGALPKVVRGVALRARQKSDSCPSVSVRAQTRSGQWLTLRAAVLDAGARVAIVLQRSRPAEVAPLLLAAHGLTARECEVAKHVLRGLSTEDISQVLSISRYTVQDHLKAIFDQTGVGSRKELAAQLFLRTS